tara:strand:+ start:638 stop:1828 length:1191 start_codon:yes stop_codon:yes gene_type:complete
MTDEQKPGPQSGQKYPRPKVKSGIGTSKEDKTRKRRSLPYEKMASHVAAGVKEKQGGGMANTGRTNLLEEVGRLDAEHMNPNRMAEKSRVIGELNRGYKKGGGVVKARVGKMMRKSPDTREKQHTLLSTGKKIPKSEVDKMRWGVRKNKKQAKTKTDYDYAVAAKVEPSVKYHLEDKKKFKKEHPILSKILPGGRSDKEIKELVTKRYQDHFSKRGLLKSAKGGVAKKQGGGAMFSRGYGVGEPSKRTPTALLDRGPAYKKGGVVKAESGTMAGGPKSAGPSSKYADIFKKARERYSGRLKRDDLDPTASTARERAIAKAGKKATGIGAKARAKAAATLGPHKDVVRKRQRGDMMDMLKKHFKGRPKTYQDLPMVRPARGQGGGIAKRGLGIIKKG